MAITDIGTASAVNVLLQFLLPSTARQMGIPGDARHIDQADAIKAAEMLATEARKKMGAGISATMVRNAAAMDGARLALLDQDRMVSR